MALGLVLELEDWMANHEMLGTMVSELLGYHLIYLTYIRYKNTYLHSIIRLTHIKSHSYSTTYDFKDNCLWLVDWKKKKKRKENLINDYSWWHAEISWRKIVAILEFNSKVIYKRRGYYNVQSILLLIFMERDWNKNLH